MEDFDERSVSVRLADPTLFELAQLSDIELEGVARTIAERKRQQIASLAAHQIASYADDTHEYGVTFRDLKNSTQRGRLLRLADPRVWIQKIRQSADEHREHQAALNGHLGSRLDGRQLYCTNESLQRFIDRKSRSDKKNCNPSISWLAQKSYQGAGKVYLMAKALAENARSPDFVSLFITFTCPSKYHSSSKSYAGYSAKEAQKYLESAFSSLMKHLSKKGKAGVDFFGVRGVEPHEDGCPHWHVAPYIKSSLESLVIEKLRRIYSSDNDRPAGYFDRHITGIIKKKLYDDPDWFASISYIFKTAFTWRSKNPARIMDSLRQKISLGSSGIRQYQLIGACGRVTKIDELWKKERSPALTPPESQNIPDHGTLWIEAKISRFNKTRGLISGDADNYQLKKDKYSNKYGEVRHKICGISRLNQEAIANPPEELAGWGRVSHNYSSFYGADESHGYKSLPWPLCSVVQCVHDPPAACNFMAIGNPHELFFDVKFSRCANCGVTVLTTQNALRRRFVHFFFVRTSTPPPYPNIRVWANRGVPEYSGTRVFDIKSIALGRQARTLFSPEERTSPGPHHHSWQLAAAPR